MEIPNLDLPEPFDLADISFYKLLDFLYTNYDLDMLHHPLFVLCLSVVYISICLYLINYFPPFVVIPFLLFYVYINFLESKGLLLMLYLILEILLLVCPRTRAKAVRDLTTPANSHPDKKCNVDIWMVAAIFALVFTGYLNYGTHLPPPFFFAAAVVFTLIVLVSANITTVGKNSSGEIFLYSLIAFFFVVASVIFFLIMYMHGRRIIDHLVSLMIDIPPEEQPPINYEQRMPDSLGITADIWHITKIDHYLPIEFTVGGWTPYAMIRTLVGDIIVLMIFCSYYYGPGEVERQRCKTTPKLNDVELNTGFGTLNFALFYTYSLTMIDRKSVV